MFWNNKTVGDMINEYEKVCSLINAIEKYADEHDDEDEHIIDMFNDVQNCLTSYKTLIRLQKVEFK